jgi:hypothetical protein
MIEIKDNDECSAIEKEVFKKARDIDKKLLNKLWLEKEKEINKLIRKHNGLERVLVTSYFSTIFTEIFMHNFSIMVSCVNQTYEEICDQQEIAKELFKCILDALRFRLDFKDKD